MRILHFSDLHIGVENYGRTDPNTGLSTRLGDFLRALDELVEYALANGVDLVIMAGDAYKGRDPSQTHQREFARRLLRLSNAGIPTFLLAGNHDLPAASGRANAVEIFSTLQVPKVYVGARPVTYAVPTRVGPLQVLAVPWPSRGAMLAREETRGLGIDAIRQELERRMTTIIAQQAQAIDPDVPAVLAGHVTVNGATVGSERSMMLGSDHVLNVSAVQQRQLEYVALGHIHKHQVLRPPGEGGPAVAYSGSLERVDFSEEKDDKGFCVVDIDPAAPQGRRLNGFDFQRIAARAFVTIDVDIPENEPEPTAFVARAIARHPVAGAIVRLRIRLSAEQSARLRDSDLRPELSSAHYVASVSREVTDDTRRRVAVESSDLQPLAALKMYLESRGMSNERRDVLLERADALLASVDAEVQQ